MEGSITSPREDARQFRAEGGHSTTCECIVEMYELLWRWGNLDRKNRNFCRRFGFKIPDSVVVVKGRPYAWYFMSKKDGSLLRKKHESLNTGDIEQKFCWERREDQPDIAAVWIPMSSQFVEDRCNDQSVQFLSTGGTRSFLTSMSSATSGVLQAFVEPHGISNFLVRAVQFHDKVSLGLRTNRYLLSQNKIQVFKRCATFEGWPGLSAVTYKYACHKHPGMDEHIRSVAEELTQRITQERVRQMHFLAPNQYIALHFKVTGDGTLYFIYASIVPEREVIIQTKNELLMEDACMIDDIPGGPLIRGGTERKMRAFPPTARDRSDRMEADEEQQGAATARGLPGDATARGLPDATVRSSSRGAGSGLPLSERRSPRKRSPLDMFIPQIGYGPPKIPPAPYSANHVPHDNEEAGRYEYPPPFAGMDSVKHPLINFSRSNPS
jgi:hypothetical protein